MDAHAGRGDLPRQPAIAVAASGRQLVIWTQSAKEDQSRRELWGRILDEAGAPDGEPFQISRAQVVDPAVAARGRRREFLVTWSEPSGEDNRGPNQVVARRVGADGSVRGDAFIVAEAGMGSEVVYGGRRREFLVVWHDLWTGSGRLYGARLRAGSSEVSEAFQISPGGSPEFYFTEADVAYDSRSGRYLVAEVRVHRDTLVRSGFVRTLPSEPAGSLGRAYRLGAALSSPAVVYNRRARSFAATWAGTQPGIRRLRPGGRPFGKTVRGFRRGTTLLHQALPVGLTTLSDGDYMVLIQGESGLLDEPRVGMYARRFTRKLRFAGSLRQVSSRDFEREAGAGAIAYARAQRRARAVWVEGREPPRDGPNDPPADWEVWARGL